MATHSSIFAWRILTDRGTWWVTVHGDAESDTTKRSTVFHRTQFTNSTSTSPIRVGNEDSAERQGDSLRSQAWGRGQGKPPAP